MGSFKLVGLAMAVCLKREGAQQLHGESSSVIIFSKTWHLMRIPRYSTVIPRYSIWGNPHNKATFCTIKTVTWAEQRSACAACGLEVLLPGSTAARTSVKMAKTLEKNHVFWWWDVWDVWDDVG